MTRKDYHPKRFLRAKEQKYLLHAVLYCTLIVNKWCVTLNLQLQLLINPGILQHKSLTPESLNYFASNNYITTHLNLRFIFLLLSQAMALNLLFICFYATNTRKIKVYQSIHSTNRNCILISQSMI